MRKWYGEMAATDGLGLNIGCVEAAVMSGRLASAGTGWPNKRFIPILQSGIAS
jgi:hypothetical protein